MVWNPGSSADKTLISLTWCFHSWTLFHLHLKEPMRLVPCKMSWPFSFFFFFSPFSYFVLRAAELSSFTWTTFNPDDSAKWTNSWGLVCLSQMFHFQPRTYGHARTLWPRKMPLEANDQDSGLHAQFESGVRRNLQWGAIWVERHEDLYGLDSNLGSWLTSFRHVGTFLNPSVPQLAHL